MKAWNELEALLCDKVESVKTLLSMTAIEARLTQLSLTPFLLICGLLGLVLLTLWLSVMGILGCLVWMLQPTLIWVFTSIFLMNVLVLLMLQYGLRRHLRNMSFQKTRQYFKWITMVHDDKPAQTTDSSS